MPYKSKSQGRMRSRSRSRGRSRSRSRGRSKSPGRPKQTKSKQSPSPSRDKPKQVAKTPTTPTRTSTRIKQLVEKQEVEKTAIEKQQGDTVSKKTSNTEIKPKSNASCASMCMFTCPASCASVLVGLATLFIPVVLLYFTIFCNKQSCTPSLKALPVFPTKLSAYYDREAVLMFAGFLVFQLVLACAPVGKVVKGSAPRGGRSPLYRCNGFFSLIVTMATLAGLIYLRYPVTKVYDKWNQLASTAIVFSFVFSTVAYICSRKLSATEKTEGGNTGSLTVDFFMGRELHPQVGPINVKHFLFRFIYISWGVVNTIFVWKGYQDGGFDANLTLVAAMQGVMLLDGLLMEETISTTYTMRNIGVGFQLIIGFLAVGPFFYSLPVRFLLDHQVKWHLGCLCGFLVLNLVGYIIYRGSSSEKDRFRKDPHNPMFANFKKIPSPSGQKLLASGWWGLCRHPNYLGELIMHIAWTLPLGCQGSCLATTLPLIAVLGMYMTAAESDKAAAKKHGAAYDRYCREVKYKFIPYVY